MLIPLLGFRKECRLLLCLPILGFLLHRPKARLSEPGTLFFLEGIQQSFPRKATITVSTPALNINYLLVRTNQKQLSNILRISPSNETKKRFKYSGLYKQFLSEHSLQGQLSD